MSNGFIKVFIYEIKKLFSNRRLMFWVFAMPLIIFLFWGSIFHIGVPRNLPVAAIDYDNSNLSRELLRSIDATACIGITSRPTDLREAKLQLQKCQNYATIVIPQNFEKNIYRGVTPDVICYANSEYFLPAALIQRDFATTVATFSAGIGIKKRLAKGQSAIQAYNAVLPISADTHKLYNPYSSYNYYLNLAMFPMMFQMVVMIISIYVLGLMMKRHTALKVYELSGKNTWLVIFGKLMPYTLLFIGMGWIMNMLLFEYIGIPTQANMLQLMIITTLLILANQAIAIFSVAFYGSLRLALTMAGGFSAIAFSFSGYTFPTAGFPEPVTWIAQLFPFTPFLKCYINTAVRGFAFTYSASYYWQMLAYISLGIIAVPKFKKVILQNGFLHDN